MATTTKHFNTDQSAMVAQRRRKIERLFSVKVSVQPVPDRNLLHDIKICGAKLDMCNASLYLDALVERGEIKRTTVHLENSLDEPLIESVEKQSSAVIEKVGPDKYEVRGFTNQVVLAVDLLEEMSTATAGCRWINEVSKRLSASIQDSIIKSRRKLSNCFNANMKVKRAVLGCLNSVSDITMNDKEIDTLHDTDEILISDSDDDTDDVLIPSDMKEDSVGDDNDASVIIIDSPTEPDHYSISMRSRKFQGDTNVSVIEMTSQFQQLQTPSKSALSNTGTDNPWSLNKDVIKDMSVMKAPFPACRELAMTKTTRTDLLQNDAADENVFKPIWKGRVLGYDIKSASDHSLDEINRAICMVKPFQQQPISEKRTNSMDRVQQAEPNNPGKDTTHTASRAFEKPNRKLNKTSPLIKEINDILTTNVRIEDSKGKSEGEKAEKTAKKKLELSPQKYNKTVDAIADRAFVKAKRKLNKASPKLKEINDLLLTRACNDGSKERTEAVKVERNVKRKAEMSPRVNTQAARTFDDKSGVKDEMEIESIKKRRVVVDRLYTGTDWGTKQDDYTNKRLDKPWRMRGLDRKNDQKPDKDKNYQTKRASEELRYIVIDGSNVAMAHGNSKVFSCRGIRICVDFFRGRGHELITVFLPMWRKCRPRIPGSMTDRYILDDLEHEGVLVYTPSRRIGNKLVAAYDDRFILELAEREDGVVVSNDQYRDLMDEKASWRKLVTERLLMYTFARDNFMVPIDPLGRHGPTLDCFLRKTPFQEDAYKFFRDEFKYLNSLYPKDMFCHRPSYSQERARYDRW